MLNLDDRTGNVLTTITLFAAVAAVIFAARAAVAVFVLALLLAYLLEPLVGTVQGWLPSRAGSRVYAIALWENSSRWGILATWSPRRI